MSQTEQIASRFPADGRTQLHRVCQEKEELQQRFDTLRSIINTAGVGIIAVDEQHRIIDTNHTLAKMFGYSIDELKGKDASTLLPTNVYTKHQKLIRELSKQAPSVLIGNMGQHPLYGVHKTNGRFPIELAISNIRIGGQVVYTGIIRDRTAADRLERNLENQAKALKNRVRELEAFQELSKLGSEDDIDGIISRFIVDVVPRSTEFPDKTVTIIELEGRTYRNTPKEPVVKLSAPLLDGRLTFGFTEDIPFHSESKQNLLNAYAAELGEIIKRRKAENSVMQTERKAVMSELGVGAAHDVGRAAQEPANFNESVFKPAVEQGLKKPPHKKFSLGPVADRNGPSQREDSPPNMANFSVFDLGETVLKHLSATKNALIAEGLLRGVNISFNTTCGAGNLVNGKPGEITLIAQELIRNAAGACIEDGVVDIDIQIRQDHVQLRVSDTGEGMDEASRKRIFDPYYTAGDRAPGRGVSLSTAQNIAYEHGGEISVVRSRLGHGTTMELRLPVARHQEHRKKAGAMSILWAEDDDVIRIIAQRMTRDLSHNITFVNDGQRALEMLHINTYDLLITDMSMPRMSGWQLLKKIQGRYTHMHRVVASTYVVNLQDMERYGANYFLNKPLDQTTLIAVLDKVGRE